MAIPRGTGFKLPGAGISTPSAPTLGRGGKLFQLDGFDRMAAALRSAATRVQPSVEKVLYKGGLRVFARSQRLVPVLTGALRASGQVHAPAFIGRVLQVTITYGGAAAGYAVYVHENLEAKHRSPTRAKFLETPLKQELPMIVKALRQLQYDLLSDVARQTRRR